MALESRSILYIRPDAIGDLVIFSSALTQLQTAWPDAQHTLVVRRGYEVLAPLFSPGVHWLTTPINPFAQHPGEARDALATLFHDLEKLAPDLIVAATLNRTWLEIAIAAHFPAARRVALGRREADPHFRNALKLELGIEPATAFEEIVPADERKFDWDNHHRLVDHLLEEPTPRPHPRIHVPAEADARARSLLAERRLQPGHFVAVFLGGVANVAIKTWPAARFAELVRWLAQEKSLPVLLLGQTTEAHEIEEVAAHIATLGEERPATWLGEEGEIALLAALLAHARCYVGHDTSAMHLAAAVDRPVVGIFGGGHWPRFRPVGRQVVSVVQPLPCFGCGWDCHFADAPCIKTIALADMMRAVDLVLEDRSESFDHVIETRGLADESVRLIAAVTPLYTAQQKDRLARLHVIEEIQRENALKDMEIVALKRETQVRDRKILALTQGPTRNADEEIARLQAEAATRQIEILSLEKIHRERAAEHQKLEALIHYFQGSISDKHRLLGDLDAELLRHAMDEGARAAEEAAPWRQALHDKDVHIRNLEAMLQQLREQVRAPEEASPLNSDETLAPKTANGDDHGTVPRARHMRWWQRARSESG